jgi:hypothetical protein
MFNNDLSFEDNIEGFADEELGIAPLLAMAAPALISAGSSMLGGLFGGGKKQSAPAAAPVAAPIQASSSNPEILTLIASLPQTIREQVKQVITETQANRGTIEQANRNIAATVDAQFQPQIKAILQSLALAQTQREVTSEHNALVAEKEYKNNTTQSLAALNRQVANLHATLNNKLSGAKVIRNKRVIDILGGNNFLDSLNR